MYHMIKMLLNKSGYNFARRCQLTDYKPVKAREGPIDIPINTPRSPRSTARCQYFVANPHNSPARVAPIAPAKATGFLPNLSPAPEKIIDASAIPMNTVI